MPSYNLKKKSSSTASAAAGGLTAGQTAGIVIAWLIAIFGLIAAYYWYKQKGDEEVPTEEVGDIEAVENPIVKGAAKVTGEDDNQEEEEEDDEDDDEEEEEEEDDDEDEEEEEEEEDD